VDGRIPYLWTIHEHFWKLFVLGAEGVQVANAVHDRLRKEDPNSLTNFVSGYGDDPNLDRRPASVCGGLEIFTGEAKTHRSQMPDRPRVRRGGLS
jgi:hypothetical protein